MKGPQESSISSVYISLSIFVALQALAALELGHRGHLGPLALAPGLLGLQCHVLGLAGMPSLCVTSVTWTV